MTETSEQVKLCFLGEPVFPVDTWEADGQCFVQLQELDVVAFAETLDEAAQKAGSMIEDLLLFLVEQAGTRTESEDEIVNMISDRLGPLFAKYHAEQRRAALAERIRAAFAKGVDWRVGAPSTPRGSVPALAG